MKSEGDRVLCGELLLGDSYNKQEDKNDDNKGTETETDNEDTDENDDGLEDENDEALQLAKSIQVVLSDLPRMALKRLPRGVQIFLHSRLSLNPSRDFILKWSANNTVLRGKKECRTTWL